MSEIRTSVSFPLDDDGFFRRQCSLCRKEFKVLLTEDELNDTGQEGVEDYLVEQGTSEQTEEEARAPISRCCPYCGQESISSGPSSVGLAAAKGD